MSTCKHMYATRTTMLTNLPHAPRSRALATGPRKGGTLSKSCGRRVCARRRTAHARLDANAKCGRCTDTTHTHQTEASTMQLGETFGPHHIRLPDARPGEEACPTHRNRRPSSQLCDQHLSLRSEGPTHSICALGSVKALALQWKRCTPQPRTPHLTWRTRLRRSRKGGRRVGFMLMPDAVLKRRTERKKADKYHGAKDSRYSARRNTAATGPPSMREATRRF